MKKRSILTILTLLVLLLGITLVPTMAQDEEAPAPALVFDAPEGYEVTESLTTDNVRLEMDDEVILVFGPDTYTQVLGDGEFADDAEGFAFFLDRSGFSVGGTDSADGALAVQRVSLARRQQQGIAYLVDLGVNLRGVVISLHTGRGRVGAPPADVAVVLDSIAFPLNIIEAATTEGSFNTFVAAVDAAGLTEMLSGEGPYTIFAPNDAAFEAMMFSLGLSEEQLLAAEWLDDVLLYHIASGSIDSTELTESYLDQNSISTLLPINNLFVFTGIDGLLYVNNAQAELVGTDISATNGVIHTIDGVLLPQCAIDAVNGTGSCD